MEKSSVLKYAAVISPILAVIAMVSGWVYHVEAGLSRANDVTTLRDHMDGLNRDLSFQRGRIANLEQLFEPYLIERRVQDELKKMGVVPAPRPVSVPKKIKTEAETWARSQINRGAEQEEGEKK